MRIFSPSRFFFSVSLSLLFFVAAVAKAGPPDAVKLLPGRVGEASAQGAAQAPTYGVFEHTKVEHFGAASTALRSYALPSGERFGVQLVKLSSSSAAYALMTVVTKWPPFDVPTQTAKLHDIGTAAVVSPQRVVFFKGTTLVAVDRLEKAKGGEASLADFARALSGALDTEESQLPPLVMHLPEWETAQAGAVYAVSLPGLQAAVKDQPVLEAVSFEGGTEAVTAEYEGAGRLVIAEYSTPQFALDADAAVQQRIRELRAANQPTPSAYKRVGNYAVFVFGAPSEQAARRLVDQVKYEKDVRWLGANPHADERANRLWLNMSASVLVNTVKATGLAILVCLGVGGLFGGLFFMRRRAQPGLAESYSDAGGMLRLNLDDMTPQQDPTRLLEPAKE